MPMPRAHLCLVPLSFAAMIFGGSGSSPAQTPTNLPPAFPQEETGGSGLSAEDSAKLLERIMQMRKDFLTQKKQVLESASTRFRAAAETEAAAVEFYLACHKVVNIDRNPAAAQNAAAAAGGKGADSWRDAVIDQLKGTPSPTAFRAQLAYLAMTMDAAVKPPKEMVPRLRTFIKEVVTAVQNDANGVAQGGGNNDPQHRVVATVGKKGDRDDDRADNNRRGGPGGRRNRSLADMLQRSVMGTLFAEAYNLHNYVENSRDWTLIPLDTRSMYEGYILPFYRQEQKNELPAVWDEFLNVETALRKATSGEDAFLEWGQNQYKDLTWHKWMDLLNAGVSPVQAFDELAKLVKENPVHPRIGAWMKDLTELGSRIGGVPMQDLELNGQPPANSPRQ